MSATTYSIQASFPDINQSGLLRIQIYKQTGIAVDPIRGEFLVSDCSPDGDASIEIDD